MGLDSYLYATQFVSSCSWNKEEENKKFKSIARLMKGNKFVENGEYSLQFAELKMQVGYWRKANQIHKYFVDKCGGGKDECQDIDVSKDILKDLLWRCQTVLSDHNRAQELLPTESGFFFGSTDYDQCYYEDLEHTIDILNKIFKDAPKSWGFMYRASW